MGAIKIIANNKKARHDFFIEEVYEAGIVLTGTEIKSVRQGKVSIKESFAKIENGEMKPSIYKVLPIEEAEEAHAILERSENIGKVVLRVCYE